jgi:hypothetical protein
MGINRSALLRHLGHCRKTLALPVAPKHPKTYERRVKGYDEGRKDDIPF